MVLLNTRGCLSDAEVASAARAVPGSLPGEIVGHLAACTTCQRRLLAVDLPVQKRRAPRAVVPSRQRLLLMVLLLLAAMGFALVTLVRLSG